MYRVWLLPLKAIDLFSVSINLTIFVKQKEVDKVTRVNLEKHQKVISYNKLHWLTNSRLSFSYIGFKLYMCANIFFFFDSSNRTTFCDKNFISLFFCWSVYELMYLIRNHINNVGFVWSEAVYDKINFSKLFAFLRIFRHFGLQTWSFSIYF